MDRPIDKLREATNSESNGGRDRERERKHKGQAGGNVRSKEEVDAVMEQAEGAGAEIVKAADDTFDCGNRS